MTLSASDARKGKGILKNAVSPRAPPKTKEEQNREKALFHARLIQQQKEMESAILASIESLLDFPTSASADPTRPSDSDTSSFKHNLRHFRTTDFDDLIEERNISGQCGYVLCPREYTKVDDKGAKYRILSGKIVESRKVQRWCGALCRRYAMYVKAQLSEEPAWLRTGNGTWSLELMNEAEAKRRAQETNSSDALETRTEDSKTDPKRDDIDRFPSDLEQLALERGDAPSGLHHGRVEIAITEKDTTSAKVSAPELDRVQTDSIEGYVPKGLENLSVDDEDDLLPTI